jgi:hypothetical protein
VNTEMNFRVPKIVRKFLSSCAAGGFSRRAQLHEVMCHSSRYTRIADLNHK